MPEYNIGSVLLIILYLVLILVAAYLVTRAVGKRAMRKGMKKTRGRMKAYSPGEYVSVVDRIPVDRDKSMMVVEFNGKFYLMSTTADDIRLVDKADISEEELLKRARQQEEQARNMAAGGDEGFFQRFCDNMRKETRSRFGGKDRPADPAQFGDRLKEEINKEEKKDA